MKNILINCYYDGMTVSQAKEFIKSVYKYEQVTEKQINNAKKTILNCTNKEWN